MKFLDCIDVNPKISLEKSKIVPFIEMGNVSTIYRNPVAVERKPFDSGVKFQDGDTVVARITPCLQNGKRFYCKNIGTGFGSTEYLVFRPKNESIDNLYLYYFMKTEFIKQSMINSMVGATGRQRVNNDVFKNIEVNFPDKEKQIKIGKILSAYDDLIENNQKQIKLLEEAAQRLYKEWFVDLRFPGYETTPIIDGVPEGWETCAIKELCQKVNAGGTPKRGNLNFWNNGTIKWYKTGELKDSWLIDSEEHISVDGLESSSAKLFPKNTIIMAIYASPTLGRLGILSTNGTCNQAALCFIANEKKVSWQWLYQKLYELRDEFNAIAKGAGQQNISADLVKEKIIILPPVKLIHNYTKVVESLFDSKLSLQLKNKLLQEARDRLLPKLMNGELEV